MAPLALELRTRPAQFDTRVVLTAQHRELCDEVLSIFGIAADTDLDIMRPRQSLADLTARLVSGLDAVFARDRPDAVLVQGDTTTTFAAALAAFYRGIPVGHVEAGLRTDQRRDPFPEEVNRRMTTTLADLHFAPTATARDALLAAGAPPDSVFVTGNTVIDALLRVTAAADEPGALPGPLSNPIEVAAGRRLIAVTTHRRENWGAPLESICGAIGELVERYRDVEVVLPVHPNPAVREPIETALGGRERIRLVEPLGYRRFAALLRAAHLVLTDSGGIQEEAPSLGKPVLVLRRTTERPEAVAAGTARLVGTDRATIVAETSRLLDSPGEYERMARAVNPYGDGTASRRIADALAERLGDRRRE